MGFAIGSAIVGFFFLIGFMLSADSGWKTLGYGLMLIGVTICIFIWIAIGLLL